MSQTKPGSSKSQANNKKPILLAVAGVCLVGALVLAVMNIFGGVEPNSPLPPDKTTAAAAAPAAPGAPVNKNLIPQLQPGQRGGSRTATDGK